MHGNPNIIPERSELMTIPLVSPKQPMFDKSRGWLIPSIIYLTGCSPGNLTLRKSSGKRRLCVIAPKSPKEMASLETHRIHVWYIYLHLGHLWGTVNVDKYSIHGSYGKWWLFFFRFSRVTPSRASPPPLLWAPSPAPAGRVARGWQPRTSWENGPFRVFQWWDLTDWWIKGKTWIAKKHTLW